MKVYVGNLPFTVNDDKLRELFGAFGEVTEATIIKDKFSGRSKGFGFVTFANDEDANKSIAEMNKKQIEGREITVNEAKPMDPNSRPPRRNFGGDRGGGYSPHVWPHLVPAPHANGQGHPRRGGKHAHGPLAGNPCRWDHRLYVFHFIGSRRDCRDPLRPLL